MRRALCTATVGPSLRGQTVRSTVALREVVVTEAATVAGRSGLGSRNLGEPARRGSRGEGSWWLIRCIGRGETISGGVVRRAGCPVVMGRGDRARRTGPRGERSARIGGLPRRRTDRVEDA